MAVFRPICATPLNAKNDIKTEFLEFYLICGKLVIYGILACHPVDTILVNIISCTTRVQIRFT